jgi:uncharacterized protein YabE (DUF348 family)
MSRNTKRLAAAGLAGVVLLLAGSLLLRPITIQDTHGTQQVRAIVFTTGQALAAAGVQIGPADQLEPAAGSLIPLNKQVRIRRAVQVTLWENGLVRPITGFEPSPFALLQQNDILLGPGDQLLWNGKAVENETVLPAGEPVVLQINRARTVIVDDNGKRQAVTSAAITTARALWDAGIRLGPGDMLSIPAETRAGDNELVGYQPARPLTIQVGGQSLRARSAAQTVGQALATAGVALQGLDYAQPAEDQPLPADGSIRVVRVREEISLKETLLPYEQKTEPDPNVALDQTQITRPGQYGVQVVRERARFEDGQEVSRGHDSDWLASEPVAQIVGAGTKIVPKALDTPDGPIEYYRAISVWATSYSPCTQGYDHCSWSTSSGMRLEKGVIGVNKYWYRAIGGHRVYVTGYGFGTIGDVGAVYGKPWIDLGFDEESFKTGAFVGWTTMYMLMPAPANVPLVFP